MDQFTLVSHLESSYEGVFFRIFREPTEGMDKLRSREWKQMKKSCSAKEDLPSLPFLASVLETCKNINDIILFFFFPSQNQVVLNERNSLNSKSEAGGMNGSI